VVAAARADDAFSRATGLGSEHQSSSTATDFAAIVLQKELVPLRQGLLLPDNLIGSEGIPAHMRG